MYKTSYRINYHFNHDYEVLFNSLFPKCRKLASWQLADCDRHINYTHQSPKTELPIGVNNCNTMSNCSIQQESREVYGTADKVL